MRWLLMNMVTPPPSDMRELVLQRHSVAAFHESQHRPTVDNLLREYYMDENLVDPQPRWIGVFDDVLTGPISASNTPFVYPISGINTYEPPCR
jgi:hypothetical protein